MNTVLLTGNYFFVIYKKIKKLFRSLHYDMDRSVAILFYNSFKFFSKIFYRMETFFEKYLKESKYIDSNKFEEKFSREDLIIMGYGLENCQKITLREIVNLFGVSDGYARKIKHIAQNKKEFYREFRDIMGGYESDSTKRNKKIYINQI